jgi:hypothetical protein
MHTLFELFAANNNGPSLYRAFKFGACKPSEVNTMGSAYYTIGQHACTSSSSSKQRSLQLLLPCSVISGV